jgi:hypothetical protein
MPRVTFEHPIEVFEAPDSIGETDVEDPIFQTTAVGIARGKVRDSKDEAIGWTDQVYLHDENVEHDLCLLAAMYHEVRESFQKRWAETLAKTRTIRAAGLEGG